jgi:glucose/arabinose dehydrogenase
MRIKPMAHRRLLVPAAGLTLVAALAACSSSSSSSSSSSAATSASASVSASAPASTSAPASPSPSATASSPAAGSGAAAIAAIKKNWVTFFNGKAPAATKIALVQNGQKFATEIKASATSSSSQTAGASVQSVKLTSPTQAAVVYSILISGTPVLTKQKGIAVYQDKTWKVGETSFCALLALEGGGKTPAACSSAG